MPFEPTKITREHILSAVKKIEREQIELTPSTKWDAEINGKFYPPKELMRYAHEEMNGEHFWNPGGGWPTNQYLEKLGFKVNQKNTNPLNDLIGRYKIHLTKNGLENEIYKWKLLEEFRGRPNINSVDFFNEIKTINFSNLVYPVGITAIHQLAKEKTEEYREAFKILFDETLTLEKRIKDFYESTLPLYRELVPDVKLSHHQDERTMATFLTYYNPLKYSFYKNSFYKKLCDLLNIKSKSKLEKYSHYMSLVDDFIKNYISQDEELKRMISKFIEPDMFKDENYKLLAQDILYQTLDKAAGLNIDDEEIDEEDEAEEKMTSKTALYPLNQILYGPPGTGKTYTTINRALEILEEETHGVSREDLKGKFDEYIENGQIVFTTFHQSMSYEDFIEGIKPETVDSPGGIEYIVKPGIFKRLCTLAASNFVNDDNFENVYASFLEEIEENNGSLILKTQAQEKEFVVYENRNGNIRFHANTDKANPATLKKEYIKNYLQTGEINDWASYTKSIGAYLKTKYNYKSKINKKPKKYVIIIDEINRGNVSQIFGELITLIEESKRAGNPEMIEVELPYSQTKFSVPGNVYLIGTMNTADRSIEALDTALRRRFSFYEMNANPLLVAPKMLLQNLLATYSHLEWADEVWIEVEKLFLEFTDAEITDRNKYEELGDNTNETRLDLNCDAFIKFKGINLQILLSKINIRIELLLNRDHHIGHSYFINVFSWQQLQSTFQNNIIPLLQEYFYGDYNKIGLVLGEGFFEDFDNQTILNPFPNFRAVEPNTYLEQQKLVLKNIGSMNIDEFKLAIEKLMSNAPQ